MVKAWALAIEALQGSVVSITDDHGTTTGDCFVEAVRRPANALRAEVGNGGYLGTLTVACERLS